MPRTEVAVFPNNANSKHQWNEPWFFKLRSATKTGWMLRGGFVVGVYVLFVVLLSMDSNSPNGPNFGIVEIILLPAMVAGVFMAMIEIPNVQRMVSLTDNEISCVGALMMFGGPIHLLTGMGQWNRREIKTVQLLRPAEPGNKFPFGLMLITPKYAKPKQLAVPSSVVLNDVANHLHSIGVDVQLSEWEPAATAPADSESQIAT
jgi:hypothetical protein